MNTPILSQNPLRKIWSLETARMRKKQSLKNIWTLGFSTWKGISDLSAIAAKLSVFHFHRTSSMLSLEVLIKLSNCGAFDWISCFLLSNFTQKQSGTCISTLQVCTFWVEGLMEWWFFGKLITPNLKEYSIIQEISIRCSLPKTLILPFALDKKESSTSTISSVQTEYSYFLFYLEHTIRQPNCKLRLRAFRHIHCGCGIRRQGDNPQHSKWNNSGFLLLLLHIEDWSCFPETANSLYLPLRERKGCGVHLQPAHSVLLDEHPFPIGEYHEGGEEGEEGEALLRADVGVWPPIQLLQI